MLIDYLTHRFFFSDAKFVITAVGYLLAPALALLFHRLGQFQKKKNVLPESGSLKSFLLRQLSGDLWKIVFFFVTGCLYPSYRTTNEENNPLAKRKIFWGGVFSTLLTAVISFFLYTVFEFLLRMFGGLTWEILLFASKALTCANLSLLWFTVLPLPGSEIETLLRKKPFSEKGIAFRQNGTLPFFTYCLLGLLLACAGIPQANGQICSLSGIMSLFPVLLIGG
ncbi:MAG: hypothetical protein IIY12_04805 [Clostridia bacterium]|nr:hypothetical protein [Clostridia bacterium]